MSKHFLSRLKFAVTTLIFLLVCAGGVSAQTTPQTEKTVRYFETARTSPSKLFAFLVQLPKGGDLHSHLSGAVYAESYIQWASESGDCINLSTMYASLPPCTTGQVPIANALP